MFEWYVKVLRDYAVFRGRARRREFWYFALMNFLVVFVGSLVAKLLEVVTGTSEQGPVAIFFALLYVLYGLAVLLPSIGVSVRRLHDSGKSGWWLLLNFVPFVGAIVLLVFYVLDSDPGENKYGPNPKGLVGQLFEAT
jgi:uncharacterized membrane protein YhaH (DUF805 family)